MYRFIKIKYHLKMEQFWNKIEWLFFKIPGKLYKILFSFAESKWYYHHMEIDKILFKQTYEDDPN